MKQTSTARSSLTIKRETLRPLNQALIQRVGGAACFPPISPSAPQVSVDIQTISLISLTINRPGY